ncbi:MAG: cytochrome c oxidase subunit 3 family protein [Ignavibacteriae bacterium]|nr:cytochrome c oxidase subunit 3 family protein [Ignavibacteriota bacterium]MCB0724788.1 cytochrome c oxidase subunit 3 family protein [Ignavibacteriota bacterium]MCB9242199.1 cytochrome c oxidase subunit 3 family protein [Ignavibacteriales bacterium]
MSSQNPEIAAEHSHAHGQIHRDDTGSKMGMWLFLFTEVLLFGGMFILYAAYRYEYSDAFVAAALRLDPILGAINTVILLTSSLTVVLGIVSIQKKKVKLCMFFLWVTQACGLIFLVNKYFEWTHKIHLGLYPGGPMMEELSKGETVFYGLYYVMTGLHGLHVIVGMSFIGVIMYFIAKQKITHDNFQRLENSGLYWHLVDVIWIFLFPLFYLIH